MADSADGPLMRHERETDDDPAVDVDLSDVSLLLEKNLRHPGLFVWLLTFSAGISGLLFGCAFSSPSEIGSFAKEMDR
jgi:SP family myo-inositol transporter-like MFS transporter 13